MTINRWATTTNNCQEGVVTDRVQSIRAATRDSRIVLIAIVPTRASSALLYARAMILCKALFYSILPSYCTCETYKK